MTQSKTNFNAFDALYLASKLQIEGSDPIAMSNSYIQTHSTTATLEAHERTLASISKKNAELAGRNEALERKVDALTARTAALETRLRAV